MNMMKKTYARSAAIAIAALGVVALTAPAIAHGPMGQGGADAAADEAAIAAEIAKVRKATEKYQDIKVALAEGFILAPPGHCITAGEEGLPAEWGGMGLHYINPKMLKITRTEPRVAGDSTHTDFLHPAILLYEPAADGSMKLVGVENLVFLHAWQAAGHGAPPTFAGRSFDIMADEVGTPVDEAHNFEPHMDQHVYFFDGEKPSDMIQPFTKRVTCEHFKHDK